MVVLSFHIAETKPMDSPFFFCLFVRSSILSPFLPQQFEFWYRIQYIQKWNVNHFVHPICDSFLVCFLFSFFRFFFFCFLIRNFFLLPMHFLVSSICFCSLHIDFDATICWKSTIDRITFQNWLFSSNKWNSLSWYTPHILRKIVSLLSRIIMLLQCTYIYRKKLNCMLDPI